MRDVGLPGWEVVDVETRFDQHGRGAILARFMDARDAGGTDQAEAEAAFLVANAPLVVAQAARWGRTGSIVEFNDLVQEGMVALLEAGRRYDPLRGATLATFAVPLIRNRMHTAVVERSPEIRVPVHALRLARRIEQTRGATEQESGRAAGDAEVGAALGVSGATVTRSRTRIARVCGVRHFAPATEDEPGLDVAAPDQACPEEAALANEVNGVLAGAVEALPRRERMVVVRSFGLGGHPRETMDQIGRDLGVTRQRVQQIRQRALQRLKGCESLAALAA